MSQTNQQAVFVLLHPSLSSHLCRRIGEVAKVHVGIGECSQKVAADMTVISTRVYKDTGVSWTGCLAETK